MLAAHELRCSGEDQRTRRFDGGLKIELNKESNALQPKMVIVARSSSHAPRSWFSGEQFLTDGIKIYAKAVFDTLVSDTDMDTTSARFVAVYDVHTRFAPTGKHTEAHTTNDPSQKSSLSRAHKFISTIDKSLEKNGFSNN